MSKDLNTYLDDREFDEASRKIKAETNAMCSILDNLTEFLRIDPSLTATTLMGSRAEATYLSVDADFDHLHYNIAIEVREDNYCHPCLPYLRMVQEWTTPPGYTKLQIYFNGQPSDHNDEMVKMFDIKQFCRINNGKCFLSNRIKNLSEGTERHGPAVTLCSEDFEASTDIVLAYICRSLPREAVPWFQLRRLYNWPSSETCKLLQTMGCYVVPVGHANSPGQDLQWRISLSNQELHLMLNLNPTQYKCYILLKMIKRDLNEHCGDLISSYHCKTALFYTIEKNSQDMWTPDFLSICLIKCLEQLIEWVDQRNCPNFFIREENMFETKLTDDKQVKKIKYWLICVLEKCSTLQITNLINFDEDNQFNFKLFCKLQCAELLTVRLLQLTDVLSVSPGHTIGIDKRLTCIKYILKQINNAINCVKAIDTATRFQHFPNRALSWLILKRSLTDFDNPIALLNSFHGIHLFNALNILCEEDAISALEPYKDIILKTLHQAKEYMASKLASIMLTKHHRYNVKGTWRGAHQYCPISEAMCFQYKMKLATAYMMVNKTVLCRDVLTQLTCMTSILPVCCNCLNKQNVCCNCLNKQNNNEQRLIQLYKTLDLETMSVNQLADLWQTCFIFDITELTIAPVPLIYEAYRWCGVDIRLRAPELVQEWHEKVLVDPRVYMYFLSYKNSKKLDISGEMNQALNKLQIYIAEGRADETLVHSDTALNVLGHIYVTKGWYRLALQCFRRSWQIRPEYNAAKWHVVFLFADSQ